MMLLTRHAGRLENRTAPRTFVAATVVCLVLLALLAVVQVGIAAPVTEPRAVLRHRPHTLFTRPPPLSAR